MWKWLRRRLRQRVEPPPVVDVRRNVTTRSVYTGEYSLTQLTIQHHLQYGPMTRRQLDELLDVTTAGIHLPLMVKRGVIRVDKTRRPFTYELVQ